VFLSFGGSCNIECMSGRFVSMLSILIWGVLGTLFFVLLLMPGGFGWPLKIQMSRSFVSQITHVSSHRFPIGVLDPKSLVELFPIPQRPVPAQRTKEMEHFLDLTERFGLGLSEVEQLLKKASFFKRGADWYVLSKDKTSYHVIDSNLWTWILSRIVPAFPSSGVESCVESQGECWRQNYKASTTYGGLVGFHILLFFVSLYGLIRARMVKSRRAVQQMKTDQSLVMRALTHELRNPATSLALTIENFKQEFDGLPEKSQHDFLVMCDEVQRLNRVIAVSKDYLASDIESEGVSIQKSHIRSLENFLERVVEELDIPVELTVAQDVSFHSDPYWLKLCVSNLIKNARDHGAPPIRVTTHRETHRLSICVQDEGCIELDREVLLTPFKKSASSSGMGIGLGLVFRIVELLGGEMLIEEKPTRFSIQLEVENE
jgi:two-component sensor histidine kinase